MGFHWDAHIFSLYPHLSIYIHTAGCLFGVWFRTMCFWLYVCWWWAFGASRYHNFGDVLCVLLFSSCCWNDKATSNNSSKFRTTAPNITSSNITSSTQQNQHINIICINQNGYCFRIIMTKHGKYGIWNVTSSDVLIKINKYADIPFALIRSYSHFSCLTWILIRVCSLYCGVSPSGETSVENIFSVGFIINCPAAIWCCWTSTNARSMPIHTQSHTHNHIYSHSLFDFALAEISLSHFLCTLFLRIHLSLWELLHVAIHTLSAMK